MSKSVSLDLRSGQRLTAIHLIAMAFFISGLAGAAVAAEPVSRPDFARGKARAHNQNGNNRDLTVELARTDTEIAYGLMYISDLPPGVDGMLFYLPDYGRHAFWMKNTVMPLDIVFLDEQGAVVNIFANTRPLSTERLISAGPSAMALEVKAGQAAAWGIGPGTIITAPAQP